MQSPTAGEDVVETRDELLRPGMVVRLRERLWRVDYRDGDTFGATVLDGRDTQPCKFHMALEDVQSGSMPYPDSSAVGDQRDQSLLLDAYRFSLMHGTAPILGLQRSRAIPTDFQLVPLLMAMESERVRLLIADDVGTGKTVEAGLILAELLARGRARRILVVVPANLRDQWRDTLENMFHIDATVVAGHLLPALERKLLPGQSVWAAHDVVIASIDYLKTRTEEVLSHEWDVVLVDEAHLAAQPHAFAGRSSTDMERHAFARAAASRTRHLILLSATPHNGYSDSYQSLFRMLDPTLVKDAATGPRLDRARARESHVVQRRRSDIEAWYAMRGVDSPFPKRDSDEIIIDLKRHKDFRALTDELNAYASDLYGSATTSIVRWLAAHLQKRLLSSPAALRVSINKRLASVAREADIELGSAAARVAEEATADQIFTEDDERDAPHLTVAAPLPRQLEIARLETIRDLALKVTAAKDPKLARLISLIPERMAAHPRAERVLVFTKFKDTLDYLVTNLTKAVGKGRNGLPEGTKVFAIYGAMNLAERNRVFGEFEQAERAVLVATDCISEGVNLQRACAELVHYELPWNPNRIEQRNGRVDRFQQREPVVGIRTLVFDDALDASLLYLIVRKSEQIRADYGFVPPFLANTDILLYLSDPGTALRGRLTAASGNQLTLTDYFEYDDDATRADAELERLTAETVAGADALEAVREESFYGQTGISLTAIEDALTASREATGTADHVKQFTIAALQARGATVAIGVRKGTHVISSTSGSVADVAPQGHQFTFDPELGVDDPTLDVIDLAHPLLRRLIDLTLDDARLPDCRGRVTARSVITGAGHAAILHVLYRYVANAEPPVLLEELIPLAYRTTDGHPVDPDTLLGAPSGTGSPYPDDVRDDAHEILTDPGLGSRLEQVGAERGRALADRHGQLTAAWAEGLSDVTPTSHDLVAVTVIYPQVSS